MQVMSTAKARAAQLERLEVALGAARATEQEAYDKRAQVRGGARSAAHRLGQRGRVIQEGRLKIGCLGFGFGVWVS